MSDSDSFFSDSSTAINYKQLEVSRLNEVQEEIQRQLNEKAGGDVGKIDSLRHMVLKGVVDGNYKFARDVLAEYVEQQKHYPTFAYRAEPYLKHCRDLIQAIESKRNFPGLSTLSRSRQREILEKVVDHFEELKGYVKKVEHVNRDVKLSDHRSTVWIIKAFMHGTFALFVFAFCIEFFGLHLDYSFNVMLDQMITNIMDALMRFF